jgi:hypothetical protein
MVYEAPTIVEIGSVADFTRGNGNGNSYGHDKDKDNNPTIAS